MLAALLFGQTLLLSPRARAYHAEVSAHTAAQFYSLRSPYGDPFVRTRRYTQTLGLRVDDIDGNPALDVPELSFDGSVRLDADFGVEPAERDPDDPRFVPGLEDAPIDLMYAYFDAKRLLGGLLGLRIGRQYLIDALGFWSFDGLRVTLTTPVHFAVTAYAGFEQRGGLPLSSSRFEADGVLRGNRFGLEPGDAPYYLRAERLAPALGFSLASSGLAWLEAELDYRRVINRDAVITSPFADENGALQTIDEDRVSSEQIGAAVVLTATDVGALFGSAIYDIYNETFSRTRVGADWYASRVTTLGAEYEYYRPTFDGDSVFNWFVQDGASTLASRARFELGSRVAFGLTSGVRWYAGAADVGGAHAGQYLGGADARYAWADGAVGLRGRLESGSIGHVAGSDVTLTQAFEQGTYDTRVVLSLYDWSSETRPLRDTTSFTYVLGGGVRPFDDTRIGAEWEHSVNDLVGQRFRALATLDVVLH